MSDQSSRNIPLASGTVTLMTLPSSVVILPGVIVSFSLSYNAVMGIFNLIPDWKAPESQDAKTVAPESKIIEMARLLKGNTTGLNYFNTNVSPPADAKTLLQRPQDDQPKRGLPPSTKSDPDLNLIIGVVPQITIGESAGDGKAELFSFATVCSVVRLEKHAGNIYKIVLEGLGRLQINKFLSTSNTLIEADCLLFVDGKNGPSGDSPDPSSLLPWTEKDMKLLTETTAIANEIFAVLHGANIPANMVKLSNLRNGIMGIRSALSNRLEGIITGSNKDVKGTAGSLVDLLVSIFVIDFSDQLKILAAVDITERMELAKIVLAKSLDTIRRAISNDPRSNAIVLRKNASPRSTFNRPKGIKQDGNDEDPEDDLAQLQAKLSGIKLPIDGEKIVRRELNRMKRMNSAQAEYQVARTYLEVISEIPWNTSTNDSLTDQTVIKAKAIMDEDHFGLELVKKRLLEYLAVLQLKYKKAQQLKEKTLLSLPSTESSSTEITPPEASETLDMGKSPILLLVGPPGVGKTSLAKSMARALGRKFQRISLGGIRDEAEIRGHRRTYIGAMPGILVQSLRNAGVNNPVILLDEIDKIAPSGGNHGDPSAAMLEVLDPEQNANFRDHYVDFPVDLSKVLFIATANNLDSIPSPLYDRMEMIYLDGYTYFEKSHIARNHLLPKQIIQNGLELDQLKISDDLLLYIANKYTREAGVRNFERCIGSICRGKAVEYVQNLNAKTESDYKTDVTLKNIHDCLGIERYTSDEEGDEEDVSDNLATTDENLQFHNTSLTPGVVNGLAYMGSGNGGLLKFETTSLPGGSGNIKLTGKLGDVIQESAHIAMSWVRINSFALGITATPTENVIKNIDIHIHAPAGAIPKDGPSAGVAMTMGLVSLFLHRTIPNHIAMTGEMTLRGKVLPVGGIREKLLGAHLAGIKLVILPWANRKDVEEERKKGSGGIFGLVSVKNGHSTTMSDHHDTDLLEIRFVKNIWQAISIIFGQAYAEVKTDSRL